MSTPAPSTPAPSTPAPSTPSTPSTPTKPINPNKLARRLVFRVYREEDGREVCRIHYKETIRTQEAYLEELAEELPIDIKIGTKSSEALMTFLQDRVLPTNRMFIQEELSERNLDPKDWITRLKLNQGKTYTDDVYITIEKEGGDGE